MKRILTGDRPTGKLHLGHFVGSLKTRVQLQNEYETFLMVADVQALTDNFDNPEKVRNNIREVVMDNLAVGIDPNKVTYFIQSQVPEIAELTIFFMNLVSFARLQRNPTVKDEMKQKGFDTNVPTGFVCYPISQAADILAFKADLVPVGEDQRPMVELAREIATKFNSIYGQVFPIPDVKVGDTGRLIGTDGNAKMGKSLGNVISLSDSPEQVEKMVMSMYTDPNRIKATDPGTVEGNPLFIYLDTFGVEKHAHQIDEYKKRYQEGTVGDIEVKKYLAELLNEFLTPIREKRKEYENQPELIDQILKDGTAKAKAVAAETMADVRKAMKLDYFS